MKRNIRLKLLIEPSEDDLSMFAHTGTTYCESLRITYLDDQVLFIGPGIHLIYDRYQIRKLEAEFIQ